MFLFAACHTGPRAAGPESAGSGPAEMPTPPVAEVRPTELIAHGHTRVDEYYWLREREDQQVLDYLAAENAYTDQMMAHTEGLQETLFEEIKGRIVQTDASAPVRDGDYLYYTRYEDGKQYPIHCRRPGGMDGVEEILLDVNALAEGHGFCDVGGYEISADQNILAYTIDTVGRRKYTVRFRDLAAGQDLEEEIPDVTRNIAWAEDNKTLFYTEQDDETLRWNRIRRHALGTGAETDEVVFAEEDETFNCYVWKTRSRQFLMIATEQTVSTEYRYIPAGDPGAAPALVEPRRRDHEYFVDHAGDYFYIRTNDQARNFRLMKTPVASPGQANWEEVLGHRADVLLEDFDVFSQHLVAEERREGLLQIRLRRWDTGDEHYLDFGEPAYDAYVGTNEVFDTTSLRFVYSSMTTPRTDFDYDMDSRDKVQVKQQEVLGGFDSANYRTERLRAPARDGAQVPISIVYRKGFERDGTGPLLLYGYGSYGHTVDPRFSSTRISLLDRGFAHAIAHVRGSETLGRAWYEDGKLLNKTNTFTDFIDCAEYLVRKGYTRPERLFAYGGSAGGLLMGAVANMRPDLFQGILAAVPWVDVVTTMLDDSIPLTTSEYDEWGNPNDEEYYRYMLSYSPYDNVAAVEYPNMLVLAGLHDSQVQYWEPAKWVARLRALKTGDARLLLKTEMEAGHGGPSGRYRQYRESALIYAFVLDLAGESQ